MKFIIRREGRGRPWLLYQEQSGKDGTYLVFIDGFFWQWAAKWKARRVAKQKRDYPVEIVYNLHYEVK